jgi:hypothetical protein
MKKKKTSLALHMMGEYQHLRQYLHMTEFNSPPPKINPKNKKKNKNKKPT